MIDGWLRCSILIPPFSSDFGKREGKEEEGKKKERKSFADDEGEEEEEIIEGGALKALTKEVLKLPEMDILKQFLEEQEGKFVKLKLISREHY